jgi:hypothetical protein
MMTVLRWQMSKDKLERWTLWVLALGLLITVSLNVAKSIVRDCKDLREEMHRAAVTQTVATETRR